MAIRDAVRASPAEVQRLAERIVEAVVRQGYVKPLADSAALTQRVAALMQKNLEEEAALEEEAERVAMSHSRQMSGLDQSKVIQMIKRKLAEERGFTL